MIKFMVGVLVGIMIMGITFIVNLGGGQQLKFQDMQNRLQKAESIIGLLQITIPNHRHKYSDGSIVKIPINN